MNESAAQVIDMQDQLIIKDFGIEEITTANIKLMEKQILEIPENPETKEQYDGAYRFNVDAKKLLPRIEERRKELKAPVLEKGKAIDDTAKKAVSMVQPLIEMSGTRRQAWKDEREAEKAEKERIESERLASIQAKIDMLSHLAKKPTEYNRTAEDLAKDIANLEAVEISAIDFQERTEEAEIIRNHAVETAKITLENRKKFEADQAEAARVKAEQEAEAKRLEEERAKLEAEKERIQTVQNAFSSIPLAIKHKAENPEELNEYFNILSRLTGDESVFQDRLVEFHEFIETQLDLIIDIQHGNAVSDHEKYKADLKATIDRDHAAAIIENERRKAEVQAAQADFEAAHAAALVEHEAWKERQQILGFDRVMLTTIATDLEKLIEDYEIPKLNTDDANALVLDLIASLKTRIYEFDMSGKGLK